LDEGSKLMSNIIHVCLPGCRVDSVTEDEDALWLVAHTTSKCGICPNCRHRSVNIHSYYTRSINDLPFSDRSVQVRLRIKRFRCLFPECRRRTFTEAIPGFLVAYARRTPRVTLALWHIGQVAGGQAGAQLATCLRMPTTRYTLLRLLRRQPLPEAETLHIIGIDDWAKRRGQTYGTIVVDLERHRVVDLLANREAETLTTWLSSQPNIHIVARDRSVEYAKGIMGGAPQAVQVADRWHLLKNLSEAVERALQDLLSALLKQTPRQTVSGDRPRANFPRSQAETTKRQSSRQQRLELYTRIQYLKERGHGMRRIARVLGLSRGLVTHYYKAEAFPERKSHYVPSQLDPYLGYLEQRVAEGCWNSPQLWREICALGYPGRPSQVTKWVQVRRRNPPGASAETERFNGAPLPFALPPLPTCLHLLVAQPSRLSGEEQIRLAQLQEIPALRTLYDFVQTFAQIVRQRQSERLDAWLADCHGSKIAAFQRFAASLKQDYAAVKAALELPWSNGQTEGQIHRLKMLKRQMYGRAHLDLLRLRLLYTPA
jgi:transposase